MAERVVEANGVELCTESSGDPADPPVLLIIGLGASMVWWEEGLCRMLAGGGRFVIRYDHRDTGRSVSYEPGRPGYTGADLVVDAIGVLEAHGVAAAHLVGVSAGGAFAQLLALGFPERALSLVLISTSPALPVAAELPPPTEQFVRFVQTAEVDWTDAGSVIEYPVEYQRVLAGTERPFDKAAARQRGGWLREPIQATGDHRLHARRNRRVRLQRRTAVPKIIGYRDLATLVIAIERDHDRRRGAHTATKEGAIVLTA